jgi:hypothetical protein
MYGPPSMTVDKLAQKFKALKLQIFTFSLTRPSSVLSPSHKVAIAKTSLVVVFGFLCV